MAAGTKRSRTDAAGGVSLSPHKVAKLALEDERVSAPKRGVNTVESAGKFCTHEVAWPETASSDDSSQSLLPPTAKAGPAAKEYAFKLDPFQQTAINCLETGHSVLVAAHTSAGKTVVAEYAFAMALRDKQRVIYTSPLKALSNQKYRELYEEFQDVGLMTGDVTINPNASCLVMTTEILRSMLYKGSEIVREVALVVYDEIHYLRDKERGVVWEESIILMPKSARFAFLSATIPNAREFAEWIAKTHGSPCHVVYTDYRPTPLQHYVYPAGSDGLYMVVDEKGTFRDDNFQKAVAALTESSAAAAQDSKGKGSKKGATKDTGKDKESDIYKIVRTIMERNYDPVIIFSFSKKECEALALQMSELDLNDEDEKKLVDGVFWNAVDCLSEDDRRLPQISALLPMLKRGIGIHHSGLLPILKEVIEILFQEGLLKALFATETFSTGLNMPAKTVVFTSPRKFDGGGFRWVSSGEYIQMSGRAGRRGLDDKGVVILQLDTRMEPALAKEMVQGAPDTLHSEFHLGYNMLLNMLRVDGADPETIMRASYRQFQTERAVPALVRSLAAAQAQYDSIVIEAEEQVAQYAGLLQQLERTRADLRAVVNSPKYCLPFLQPGRLVKLLNPPAEDAAAELAEQESDIWGTIINFERMGKTQDSSEEGTAAKPARYVVDVLVNCADRPAGGPRRAVQMLAADARGSPLVVPVHLDRLDGLSSVRIYIPKDLRLPEARIQTLKTIGEVQRRFSGALPLLDPEEDMSVRDSDYSSAQRRLEKLEDALQHHPLASQPDRQARLQALARKQVCGEVVRLAAREVQAAQSLILKDELKARRRVLRRLGYTDSDGVVTVKGRVAAEIQSADELVLTELIFNGVFKELTAEQVVALVSCFVWMEKGQGGAKVRDDMLGPFGALHEAARRVGKVAVDSKMQLDVEDYVTSFRPDLMDAVMMWSRGAKFGDVLRLTEVFEGSLVRAVRRLEEVLRQLIAACQVIGETDLMQLFQDAIDKIKRDIIFAASLYL
ncbi:hypothetical protein WJX72_007219 [[Myrmecia] bisecta]|uniref:Uncharacterized protein n=1 Tax=[Myrmecia] bisecta TaxID=41462 RepID=A0AAW1P978_9CHLO